MRDHQVGRGKMCIFTWLDYKAFSANIVYSYMYICGQHGVTDGCNALAVDHNCQFISFSMYISTKKAEELWIPVMKYYLEWCAP